MAQRRCYGYDIELNGELRVNPYEAAIVRWIFESCLQGNILEKLLEERNILYPTGKSKWNREALNKLLSN